MEWGAGTHCGSAWLAIQDRNRDLSRMMTGSETAETFEVWRAMKSLGADVGLGHHRSTSGARKVSSWRPGPNTDGFRTSAQPMASSWQCGKCSFLHSVAIGLYLSSKLQVSHLPWSWEKPCVPAGWSMATSQMSPYQLDGANVPATNMDLRQIGFLYWAAAIDSTQHCPPVSPKCIPVVFHQHNWHWLYWEHKPAGNNRNNYIVLGNVGGCLLCFRGEGSWLEKLSRLQKQRTLVAYALWLGKKRKEKKIRKKKENKKRNTRAGKLGTTINILRRVSKYSGWFTNPLLVILNKNAKYGKINSMYGDSS